MDRGEIYLAPFTYADLRGSKRRPVCVVSSARFHAGSDVIVVMVTSSGARLVSPRCGDVILDDWRQAGLLRPSTVRAGRLLVLEQRLLSVRLGALSSDDAHLVDDGLRDALGLS
jgi:mRNA-degrading endonuclease toxin of MazEF toxin-antitoxin module